MLNKIGFRLAGVTLSMASLWSANLVAVGALLVGPVSHKATVSNRTETPFGQNKKVKRQRSFGFDGQLTDLHTGWQFLGKGYRAYNSLLHRFMGHDSLSPFARGGINGYVFVKNNPIMQFDPSGHMPRWLSFIVPQTIGGWIGFGVGTAVGVMTGVLMGKFAMGLLPKASALVTAAGVGGVSNAAGQYVGHAIDTDDWSVKPDEISRLIISFAFGAGLGAMTTDFTSAFVSSRGKVLSSFRSSEMDISSEDIQAFKRGSNAYLVDNSRGSEEISNEVPSWIDEEHPISQQSQQVVNPSTASNSLMPYYPEHTNEPSLVLSSRSVSMVGVNNSDARLYDSPYVSIHSGENVLVD